MRARTDAAGHIQFFAGGIIPDGVDGPGVLRVAGQGCDVGHAAVKIAGAHGVADGLGLLHGRDARLMIVVTTRMTAAHVDEIFGEFEVALVAGDAVKPDEAHLNDFVSGPEMQLVGSGAEGLAEEVGFLDGDIEEVGLAGGLVVGGGGFEEMARIVKFVAEFGVVHPPVGAGPFVRMCRVDGAGGVKITVGFLGGGKQGDE